MNLEYYHQSFGRGRVAHLRKLARLYFIAALAVIIIGSIIITFAVTHQYIINKMKIVLCILDGFLAGMMFKRYNEYRKYYKDAEMMSTFLDRIYENPNDLKVQAEFNDFVKDSPFGFIYRSVEHGFRMRMGLNNSDCIDVECTVMEGED